jgi:soluble lytic murein transglycosylase
MRNEFLKAYLEAKPIDAQGDTQSLRNYVLYPYLQQHRIQLALATTPVSVNVDRAAEEFLKLHTVEPVARELRRVWYASLAARQEWEKYLVNYREVDDWALRCHALTARVKMERFDELAPLAAQLWSTSTGSLPECEIPFNWLKTQSAWTPALIEKRARGALAADNPSFARQMIALLPIDARTPLENWAALLERPTNSIDAAIANPNTEIEARALLDGWTRVSRSNHDAAMQRYASLVKSRKLDAATASRFALEVALPLAWDRRTEALDYFAKMRAEEFDERGWEWYARAALWNSDWKLVVKVIRSMPEALRQQTRWKYWLARATALLGDPAQARTQFTALMHDDNYYAALAAARLEQKYTPDQRALEANEMQLQAIAAEPPFQRARELQMTNNAELRESAYDEWRNGYNKLAADARAQSVILASRWGWYDQAILIASEQRLFNDYRLLYPHVYDAAVDEAAKLTGLPREIIYSMLRQESIFRVDAISVAGAKGLMQVKPDGAAQTARRWRLPPPGDLFDPRTNILIGTAHLKDIYNRFDGRSVLALAGYNAGPNAAARWVPTKPREADVWIENIPYNETRIYVQRVLWHSVVFGWLAHNEGQDTSAWLTTVTTLHQ